jgi:hypothetical protein
MREGYDGGSTASPAVSNSADFRLFSSDISTFLRTARRSDDRMGGNFKVVKQRHSIMADDSVHGVALRDDTVYPVFQNLRLLGFAFLVLLIFLPGETSCQVVDSIHATRRSVSNAEKETKRIRSFPPAFLYSPFRNAERFKMAYIGPYSVANLVETHPWLRDVIVREYIRTHIQSGARKEIPLASNIYARRIPVLKREALLNMGRFGVPYDPVRPALLRKSVDLEQIARWLYGLSQ